MREHANPFEDARVAARCEDWYAGRGRRADRLEKALLSELLADFGNARSALEIGCGTGHFPRWLEERGLHSTGLDAAPAMLAEAHRGRACAGGRRSGRCPGLALCRCPGAVSSVSRCA